MGVLSVWMSVYHMHAWCSQKPTKGFESPTTGIAGIESPYGCSKSSGSASSTVNHWTISQSPEETLLTPLCWGSHRGSETSKLLCHAQPLLVSQNLQHTGHFFLVVHISRPAHIMTSKQSLGLRPGCCKAVLCLPFELSHSRKWTIGFLTALSLIHRYKNCRTVKLKETSEITHSPYFHKKETEAQGYLGPSPKTQQSKGSSHYPWAVRHHSPLSPEMSVHAPVCTKPIWRCKLVTSNFIQLSSKVKNSADMHKAKSKLFPWEILETAFVCPCPRC